MSFLHTTTTTDTTADWSVLGSVLLKATSENSFEISSNSACTTTTNQDILDIDATANLSALGSVLLKTTSENSFEVSSNSACLFDNPFALITLLKFEMRKCIFV